jgi:hypothetical protein
MGHGKWWVAILSGGEAHTAKSTTPRGLMGAQNLFNPFSKRQIGVAHYASDMCLTGAGGYLGLRRGKLRLTDWA